MPDRPAAETSKAALRAALIRVATKGVYAGGGSIADGGISRKARGICAGGDRVIRGAGGRTRAAVLTAFADWLVCAYRGHGWTPR